MRATLRHTSRRTRVIAGLLAIALSASACDPAPASAPLQIDSPAPHGPRLTVASIPLPPALAWTVSSDALAKVPCTACETDPERPDAARFFYGDLPRGTVDALMTGRWADGSPVDDHQALGNMFVSGYFGGIYLRSRLSSVGVDASFTPIKALLDTVGSGAQSVVDALASALTRAADSGSDADVRSASTGWGVVFAAVHGYNRGYLDVALAHPPAGQPSGTLSCASQFGCRSGTAPLAALDTLAPTLSHLAHPDSLEWFVTAQGTAAVADSASAAGRDVWTTLLSKGGIDPTAYQAIVDLSVGFLEINQAALLANVEGAIGDVAIGRRGLVLTAALLVWIGSYFLGLASSLSDDQLPSIACAG